MPNKQRKLFYFDGSAFYNHAVDKYGSLLKFCNETEISYFNAHTAITKNLINLDLLIDISEAIGVRVDEFTKSHGDTFWICPVCKKVEGC